MKIRVNTLWSVPAFSAIAGILAYYVTISFGWFFTDISPDNVISVNPVRALILESVLFFVPLLFGGLLLFRHMTRREVFFSASLLVLYGVISTIVQQLFQSASVEIAVRLSDLFLPFEWCHFPSQLFYLLGTDGAMIWIGIAIHLLTPYCFVLFGKRSLSDGSQDTTPGI